VAVLWAAVAVAAVLAAVAVKPMKGVDWHQGMKKLTVKRNNEHDLKMLTG